MPRLLKFHEINFHKFEKKHKIRENLATRKFPSTRYNIVKTVRTYGNMSIIVNSRNSGNKNNTGNSGIFSPTVPTVTTVPCVTHVPSVFICMCGHTPLCHTNRELITSPIIVFQ